MFKRSLNPQNIVKNLNLEESDIMDDSENSRIPDPSAVILLKPGVKLNENGKIINGPLFPKGGNRMTLDEYNTMIGNRGNYINKINLNIKIQI